LYTLHQPPPPSPGRGLKENILLKKEIGNITNKCHQVCDFNFHEFQKKPVLTPATPQEAKYIGELAQHDFCLGWLEQI
jgi:hypothetical protein